MSAILVDDTVVLKFLLIPNVYTSFLGKDNDNDIAYLYHRSGHKFTSESDIDPRKFSVTLCLSLTPTPLPLKDPRKVSKLWSVKLCGRYGFA